MLYPITSRSSGMLGVLGQVSSFDLVGDTHKEAEEPESHWALSGSWWSPLLDQFWGIKRCRCCSLSGSPGLLCASPALLPC